MHMVIWRVRGVSTTRRRCRNDGS